MSKTGKVVAVMVAIAVLVASVDLFRRHRRAQAAQAMNALRFHSITVNSGRAAIHGRVKLALAETRL